MIQTTGTCVGVSEATKMIAVPVEGGEEGETTMQPVAVFTATIEFQTPAGRGIVKLREMPSQLCTVGATYPVSVG